MKRPLLIVTISYILGIIIGVYFKQSILLILLAGIIGIVFWKIIKKKKIVINNLRKEVLKKYNSFYKDDAFREMPKKRQIIALLNAYGLCSMSMMLLKITEIIKNNIRK